MKKLGGTDLKRLHREWRRGDVGRLSVMLEDVEGPFNVGAIIRTAAAYRIEALHLAGATPGPDSPRVGRTSMGTDRFLRIVRHESGLAAVESVRGEGLRVIGLELAEGARPLHEIDDLDDCCLVVGHEDRGVGSATLDACDEVAFLPQLGKVGSLNVATATALAIYEVRRRGWTA